MLRVAKAAIYIGGVVEAAVCNGDACERPSADDMSVLQSRVQKHEGLKSAPAPEEPTESGHHAKWIFDIVQCPTEPVLTTETMDPADYDAIMEEFKGKFDALPTKCEGMDCPIADVCGCILRMAGHDFMDYKAGVGGGSDACTDMAEPDNAGLEDCLLTGMEGATIKEVYVNWCSKISLADFVVLAAEAAMTYTRHLYLKATDETEDVRFKAQFHYGRTTSKTCEFNQMLPDPTKSCRDVERVFIENMELDWKMAAALMGVHTLGRAAKQNSGFFGWWSDAKNSRRFNNNYYVSLILKGWTPEKVKETGRWQWGYSDLNRNDEIDGHQMMLDSDFCLAFSDRFGTRGYKEMLAEERPHGCAWTMPNLSFEPGKLPGEGQFPLFEAIDKYNDGKFCGVKMDEYWRALPGGEGIDDRMAQWRPTAWYTQQTGVRAMTIFADMRAACCNGCLNFEGKLGEKCIPLMKDDGFAKVKKDVGVVSHPSGKAKQYVMEFANNESIWLEAFHRAWKLATGNGFPDLKPLMVDYKPPDRYPKKVCNSHCLKGSSLLGPLHSGHEWCETRLCGACTECEEAPPEGYEGATETLADALESDPESTGTCAEDCDYADPSCEEKAMSNLLVSCEKNEGESDADVAETPGYEEPEAY